MTSSTVREFGSSAWAVRSVMRGKDGPVTFGVYGAIAEHYGVSPDADPPGTTTIGYLVAAAGG